MESMESTRERAAGAERVFLDGLSAGLPGGRCFAAPFVVAVSGGADSVALLLGLHALAGAAGAEERLIVAHGLHDLRAEAAADADFVRRLAAELNLRCVVAPLAVREGGGGEGVEARARRLRYAFLAAAAHDHGARHVAVAHTADDQAETILHRALRGTGVAGLAGMRRARELAAGVALVRPLLDIPRAAARDYLRCLSRAWCEDATNADTRRARGLLRHEILPRCAAGPYPAAAAALVRLGRQAGDVAATLAAAADVLLDAHAVPGPDAAIGIAAGRLARLDRGLVTAVLAAAWRRAGWPLRDMTAAHYERLAALVAAAAEPRSADLAADFPGGVRATLDRAGRLTLTRRG